jgi:diacylglycerol kinase (ATP)
MHQPAASKLVFIINPAAGNNNLHIKQLVTDYFTGLPHQVLLHELPPNCSPAAIKQIINKAKPHKVIAAGGDGTIKMVAECLLNTGMALGILPAGSANGMAKELGIPTDIMQALDVVVNGATKQIHAVYINKTLCIHLSDIGFNAFVVKNFESYEHRGMWGYIKAAWTVLKNNPLMSIQIHTGEKQILRDAEMVVIANATKYGTGVLINPEGTLEDDLFEVIIVKKISLGEIFKMRFTHAPYDVTKTEILQTDYLKIASKRKVHFQVDGEYMGKVKTINASIIKKALNIIVPAVSN